MFDYGLAYNATIITRQKEEQRRKNYRK